MIFCAKCRSYAICSRPTRIERLNNTDARYVSRSCGRLRNKERGDLGYPRIRVTAREMLLSRGSGGRGRRYGRERERTTMGCSELARIHGRLLMPARRSLSRRTRTKLKFADGGGMSEYAIARDTRAFSLPRGGGRLCICRQL